MRGNHPQLRRRGSSIQTPSWYQSVLGPTRIHSEASCRALQKGTQADWQSNGSGKSSCLLSAIERCRPRRDYEQLKIRLLCYRIHRHSHATGGILKLLGIHSPHPIQHYSWIISVAIFLNLGRGGRPLSFLFMK